MTLSDLAGEGWTMVGPPEKQDPGTVIGRYEGEPIKGGILMEELQDSPEVSHLLFRSGQYDVEVKIDFEIGRGQVRVEKAPGYEEE